ncbi:AAA domain-containing protein [uncultured Helicobacter sp.]|uniref:AAA domain-containing protein n=1 Tax=uncultured Helicobacter sp. TaxID=175537 RepID=UPI003752540B
MQNLTTLHIIFLKGKDKTESIESAYLEGEKLVVKFQNQANPYTYNKDNFKLFPKATNSSVFTYLKTLSKIIRIQDNKSDEPLSLLAKEYDKIRYIPKDCVFLNYLSKTTKSKQSQTSTTQTQPTQNHSHNPILAPFGLNLSQYQALQNALSHQISVIEGPPGTGKTQTILNLIANLLYRGKTIAVLSNNNSATHNVYEKLSKYNLSYLCATLGNKENKEKFIANQNSQSLDTTKNPSLQNINTTIHTLQESHQKLQEFFTLQNSIATTKAQLEALQLEYKYFKTQELKSESSLAKTPKLRTLFATPTPHTALMLKVLLEEDSKEKISIWLKLRAIYGYGIGDFRFYQHTKQEILKALENLYYTKSIANLQEKLQKCEKTLQTLKAQNPLQTLQNCSLSLLQHHLSNCYKERQERQIFSLEDLRTKAQEFLKEYPIIFSTTHSITSSLGSMQHQPLFDYVIIDEASQVDLLSGGLALLCAKNAVIVGDTKQLPNVIDKNTQQEIEALNLSINAEYDYTKQSLLSSIVATLESTPKVLLKEHYRCHPKIIGFCNQRFYDNKLIILSKDTTQSEPIQAYITPTGNHARGFYNQREIDVITKEILPSLDFSKEEIGIITPYREQKKHLQSALQDIETDTIHKYQGREKEAIILSTTANESNDFINDSKILNVAISRAKSTLRIVTSEQIAQGNNNISDFIKYIRYHNFAVQTSKVKSIFDLLYKANTQARLAYLKGKKRISQFDSENLAFSILQEVLKPYPSLDVATHIPLYRILRSTSNLSDEERVYALNPLTHLDFLLYNTMDKSPVCGIEVDGFAFHKAGSKQADNDKLKDSILQKVNLPLLRLSTIESDEKERIEEFLRTLGYDTLSRGK